MGVKLPADVQDAVECRVEGAIELRNVITCAIDDVAMAALRNADEGERRCSVCEDPIVGEPGGTGLMMWTRGDDVRYDEPLLCGGCAASIAVHAWNRWQQPDGGDGD
jgi:hypothetical protein